MEEKELEGKRRSFTIDGKWFRRLTDYVVQIPSPSPALRRRILALKDTPPSVLRGELAKAKEEVRAWQERAIARQLGFWHVERKLEKKKPEKLTEAKPQETTRLEQQEQQREVEKKMAIKPEESRLLTRVPRKDKRLVLTEEELRMIEKKKRAQQWNLLKRKVKEYDELLRRERELYYPRISAAYAQMYADETLDEQD